MSTGEEVPNDADPPPGDLPGYDGDPASTYLRADFAPRGGSWWTRISRATWSVVAGLLRGDLDAGVSTVDVVVRRRDTGARVLRLRPRTLGEAERLLATIRFDLDVLDVTRFAGEWASAGD